MQVKRSLHASVIILSCVWLFALGQSSILFAQLPAPIQQGALPAARNIPAHDYDTRHVKLDLHFDWDREQVQGTSTITFAPLITNLRRVELDAGNMSVSSITLAAGVPLKYQMDTAKEKLRVELDRPYQPADEITIVVSYHTNGRVKELGSGNYARGLVFNKPSPDDPYSKKQIYSQGESEFNHLWFPAYDHPNDFSTSELIATVDKPLTVISNGRLVDVKDNGDHTQTFHWLMEQPHANYLTSIVVGEYTPLEQNYAGIPVINYVYPNEVAEGKVSTARLAEMVRFFSEKTGVKYPYAKYAQTMVHNFPGGMENISATTQTDTLIHDARSELDATSDSLESHELAHQWFGDDVTCRDWSDIWLNESFATYFQALWDEHSLGHDDFLYADVRANQDSYFDAWRKGLRRPVVTKNYRDPEAVFDVYAYPRGGAVLHMLRNVLGEENWWRAINHYLTKYAHQPVETEQFRIAIEEATGQPLDWFFDEWVYKMGHPIFKVTQSYDAAKKNLSVSVRQEQKVDPANGYPQVAYFQTPVEIEIATNSNKRIERVWIAPQEEQTFNFNVEEKPLLVNFDYGRTLIRELHFEKTTNELAYQLAHDEDMLGRLWALEQLSVRLKQTSMADAEKQQIVSAFAAALKSDKFWGVRVQVASALKGMAGAVVRQSLLAAVKDEHPKVRAQALDALGETHDATLASVYQQALDDQSYAVVTAAATALGQTKSPAAYDALVKLLDVPSWHDQVRAAALGGLDAIGDRRALEAGLRFAGIGNPTPVRKAALTLLANVGKNDPRTLPLLLNTLQESFAHSDLDVTTSAATAIYELDDMKGLSVLRDVLLAASKLIPDPDIPGFLHLVEQRLKEKQAGTMQKNAAQP